MAEYAMQLALDSIYGRLRSHYRFLSWPMPARLPHVRVKTLGERSFLFSKTSRCLDGTFPNGPRLAGPPVHAGGFAMMQNTDVRRSLRGTGRKDYGRLKKQPRHP